MPFLQINTIPRPSHSTQSPPAHAHSTATCSCTHLTATCSCTHFLYAAFMNTPISYQQQHQGCPAITTPLLHPAASTRKLECLPLLLAPLPRSGTRHVVHPFAVQLPPRLSFSYPQLLPLQASPSCLFSWKLECPPLTAGTTPSLGYVYVVHPFAVQLSTSHAATTASKPAHDHTYPLLVQQLGYTTAYGCLPFLYILAAVSTLENVHLCWYW